MAGRGPQTFKKRQKEQQRRERQQEKFAKRLQRKAEKRAHPSEGPPIGPADLDMGGPLDTGVEEPASSETL